VKSPEGYEKDEICKYLDKIDVWYFRPYMAGFGKSGVPDIIGCWIGLLFAIEVKRPGKEPTPVQRKRMAEITEAGGMTFWGTAEKVLKEFKAWRYRIANEHADRILSR
jgi:Holliday junction resolvase